MKKYQKAQMIAKNLPTGSYAAGCPAHTRRNPSACYDGNGKFLGGSCTICEVAK